MGGDQQPAGGLIEPPPSQLNLFEYILFKHSLLSLCFRRSKLGGVPVRQRVFFILFSTAASLAVAMQADMVIGSASGWQGQAGKLLTIIALTIFVVTPLTCILRCQYASLTSFLNDRIWCVSAWTGSLVRVEELLLLAWLLRTLAFGLFDEVRPASPAEHAACRARGAGWHAEGDVGEDSHAARGKIGRCDSGSPQTAERGAGTGAVHAAQVAGDALVVPPAVTSD